jgi:Flp pilus assembly protein TadD
MTRRHATLVALFAIVLPACATIEATRSYRTGTAALDRGDAARAVADLERAADLAPGASHIQNHLGIAYEEVGRPDDAARAYERAVALDCENAAAQANLARIKSAYTAASRP